MTQFSSEIFVHIMSRKNWIYIWFRANMSIPKGKTKNTEGQDHDD